MAHLPHSPSATIACMGTPGAHPAASARPVADAPLVSVMVPVFNVERYLPQCVDSILAQDYDNLDILLVDDGSTDGCGTLCDSYASLDRRVRVLHTENRGLAAARNACLAHARADLLLFVDADDWIEPNTVSTLVGTMLATGSDMVSCRYMEEWVGGTVRLKENGRTRTLEGEDILAELIRGTIGGVAWGKLCRASAYSGISYPEGRAYEDVFTTHLVCKQVRRATCLPDALFHYRIRSGGISHTRSVSVLFDYWFAHGRRQADLPDVPDELQALLLRHRIFAIYRAWCWLASCPREDRRAAREEIRAMSRFARESLPAVLRGRLDLTTKARCIVCTVPSLAVWIPLNLLVRAQGRTLAGRKPFEYTDQVLGAYGDYLCDEVPIDDWEKARIAMEAKTEVELISLS